MISEIKRIHQSLVEGTNTCVGLVEGLLSKLENSDLNTGNFILRESSLEKAKLVDAKIANGESIGLFEGIPFGLKDVYLLEGEPAAASSQFLNKYISPYSGTAVQKLLDAGAIPIVKENCDAFGHGSTNENSAFGRVLHATMPEKVAGGSSGGSAVNVAKEFTVFSLGGDTGGSIRQPAGYNKIYGFKPSYGRISRYGIMAYASSTDCVGPLARTLEDVRLITNLIAGKDEKDQTTFESSSIEELGNGKPAKVGYYTSFVENDAIHPDISKDFLDLLETLKKNGVQVKPLDFYDGKVLVSTYYTLAMAETASNLARLDGTNFGNRLTGEGLKEIYAETRSQNFTEETKRRIVGGNQVLSQGLSEEIYLKANAIREDIKAKFEQEFEEVDIILSPVTPSPVPLAGATKDNPLAMYLSDAYTVGFSLGGLPTLTAPFGPETGLQISAAHGADHKVLEFANFLETVC